MATAKLRMLQPLILQGHTSTVNCCRFLDDDIRLLSCSSDTTLRMWDTETQNEIQKYKCLQQVSDCSLSSNNLRFASGDFGKNLKIWDTETGQIIWREELDGVVTSCCYAHNDKIIASASNENYSIQIWDALTGKIIHTYTGLHSNPITSCVISSNSDRIASSSMDGRIQYIDLKNESLLNTFSGHYGVVSCCCFSPCNQNIIASSSWDRTICVWNLEDDIANDQRLVIIKKGHGGSVSSVTYSPDGDLMASTGYDSCVFLWEPADVYPIISLKKHTDWINHCNFSKDQKLATCSSDKTIHIWQSISLSLINHSDDSGNIHDLNVRRNSHESLQITELTDEDFFSSGEIIYPHTIEYSGSFESLSDMYI